MKQLFGAILILGAGAAISYVGATSAGDIIFPVRELGSCRTEAECKKYCERPQNLKPCLDFAETHNLIDKEELAMARKFAALGGKGPGGCSSKETCDSYCNDVSHIDECVDFAERNGFLPPDELDEAKKVREALKKGARLPGGCRSKTECDNYCGDPNHMEECITFAEAAGFIPPDELEDARKALAAIKKGARPPPCRGKQECDRYCSEPQNMEVCLTFAEAAGFIPADELVEAKKVLQAVKKGVKPPPCRGREDCDRYCSEPQNLEACLTFAEAAGLIPQEELEEAKKAMGAIRKGVKPPKCRGKAECDEYCQQPENMEECITFAEAAGFMGKEEAEMARKTGGKGPGECRGKEECERFCADPANQEVCFRFGLEHGLIPPEELEKMKEGLKQAQEALQMAPPQVLECIVSRVGAEAVEKIKSGDFMPDPRLGDALRTCFEKLGPPGPPPEGGPPGPPRQPGPPGALPPEGGLPPGVMPPGSLPPEFECICTKEFAPVCGTDGRTYGNRCELGCLERFGVALKHEGPCEGELEPPSGTPPPLPFPETPQSFLQRVKGFLANVFFALLP